MLALVALGRAKSLLLRSSMKTLIRLSQLLFALPLSIALSACGKSSTSSTTTSSGYYLSNGYCYASSTGTIVATSYCSSTSGYYLSNGYCYSSTGSIVATAYCTSTTSTTGYTYSNGYCYSTATGTVVATAYCTGTTTGTTTGTISTGTCYGQYYYTNGYMTQIVQCYGANCRGYTLYEYNTRMPIYCQ